VWTLHPPDSFALVTRNFRPFLQECCRARSEPDGTRWCTGGEVKGKLTNGVGSQYSHATPPPLKLMCTPWLPAVDWTDAPHRFKWTRLFRGKTKSGFCACAITFRTSYYTWTFLQDSLISYPWIYQIHGLSDVHTFTIINI